MNIHLILRMQVPQQQLKLKQSVAATEIFIWGLQPRRFGGWKFCSGVQGQSPGPPETEAVFRHCLQTLTAETIGI